MTKLYSTLAHIYHEMYEQVFDYNQEFDFYNTLLKDHNCLKILEVGCGSGMLARRFLKAGYEYLGLDLYDEMLTIARTEIGSDRFVQGDMRHIDYDRQFDAVMITGRSLAYVTENQGVMDTLKGIHKALKDHGLFVFGVFNAPGIFENFDDFEQHIELREKKITRKSHMKMNLVTGWTYDWYATYIIEHEGKTDKYDDHTLLRAFTEDEILLFLKLTGFICQEIIREEKTLTLITEKKSG